MKRAYPFSPTDAGACALARRVDPIVPVPLAAPRVFERPADLCLFFGPGFPAEVLDRLRRQAVDAGVDMEVLETDAVPDPLVAMDDFRVRARMGQYAVLFMHGGVMQRKSGDPVEHALLAKLAGPVVAPTLDLVTVLRRGRSRLGKPWTGLLGIVACRGAMVRAALENDIGPSLICGGKKQTDLAAGELALAAQILALGTGLRRRGAMPPPLELFERAREVFGDTLSLSQPGTALRVARARLPSDLDRLAPCGRVLALFARMGRGKTGQVGAILQRWPELVNVAYPGTSRPLLAEATIVKNADVVRVLLATPGLRWDSQADRYAVAMAALVPDMANVILGEIQARLVRTFMDGSEPHLLRHAAHCLVDLVGGFDDRLALESLAAIPGVSAPVSASGRFFLQCFDALATLCTSFEGDESVDCRASLGRFCCSILLSQLLPPLSAQLRAQAESLLPRGTPQQDDALTRSSEGAGQASKGDGPAARPPRF